MIWYSVNIRYDEVLITFMKRRDAKLPKQIECLGYLDLRQRDSPNLTNFQNSTGGKTANAWVAVVDF